MDATTMKSDSKKSSRPVRNRRYSRRSFTVGHRPAKRLFTPEIKRFLKEWLIRRRDNPYPNRDEKKMLAMETGLTYIQICNWFANWRRKLKNAGNEHPRKTWGHLIKTYNDQAQGNVEQFSICSDDSIWGEAEPSSPGSNFTVDMSQSNDHCYTNIDEKHCDEDWCRESYDSTKKPDEPLPMHQFNQVSSTTEEAKYINASNTKYKNHMMKKYLRGLESHEGESSPETQELAEEKESRTSAPLMLSKWLESAAKFQPRESNYVCWSNVGGPVSNGKAKRPRGPIRSENNNAAPTDENIELYAEGHGREEVEAAVALTRLANLFAMRS